MPRRTQLMHTIRVFLVSALVVLTVLIVIFQVIRSRQGFGELTERVRTDYIAGQKALIKQEVLQTAEVINHYRSRRDRNTRKIVRARTLEAYAIAEQLYRQNHNRMNREALEELISGALRPIRFSDGLGYYFITRMDGREILFADRPGMEGKNLLNMQDSSGQYVVKDMLAIAEQKGEGFYDYHWTKPGSDESGHRKIAFIKRFAPFDWVIGTGLYVDDVEAQIKSELLDLISTVRFGREGYIFVNTLDGNALITNGKRLTGNQKLWHLNPARSERLKALFAKEREAALNPDGDYIYYNFQKMSNSEENFPKTSFIYGIPEWNWLIGAGVYLDEVEGVLTDMQNALNRDLRREVTVTILIAALLLLAFLAVFQRISRRYVHDYNLFQDFFEQAATGDQNIDCNQVRYADLRRMAEQANRMLHDKQSVKQNLQNEKERFQELSEHLPVGVFEADLDLNLTYVNRKALAVFGYTSEDLAHGLNGLDMFVPEDRSKVRTNVAQRMQAIDTDINEYVGLRKDGTTFPVISHSSPVESEGKVVGIRGFIADISERKEREEEQLRLKKLESVGVLAGGIAHDFNNLLAGLFGNIEMAKRSLPGDHKAWRYLNLAGQSMDNATKLTRQLLTFAKGGEPIKEVISIDGLLRDAAQFSLRGSNVKLETQFTPGLYPVNADRGQLNQVISNLVINARQAMPEGGILRLSAENFGEGAHRGVRISVQDQGTGIAHKYLDRIFDPYFTTKQEGSGLGLASCYSIIRKHDGRIMVESELDRGTTFTIELPAVFSDDSAVSPSSQTAGRSADSEMRSLRILLMDDEKMIRDICGEMLQEMEHQVAYAADGEEALEKYRHALKSDRPYDVLISDLTIPGGMGGLELAQDVLQLHPQAKIIVSSGYANDPVMANYQHYGFHGRVTKPFHFIELQKVIEQVLNEKSQQHR